MPGLKINRKLKKGVKAIILAGITMAGIATALVIVMLLANLEPSENSREMQLTADVTSYKSMIEQQLEEENKEDYTAVVLALMMQESGGRGTDPMQASESYCKEVGCIDDPEVSIEKGVDHFVRVLEKANGDVKLALQSYNFGEGFIGYVQENGGSYTQELTIDFSQKKYKELKHTGIYSCIRSEAEQYDACYGDIYYVDAVLKYYPSALEKMDKTVQVAQVKLDD